MRWWQAKRRATRGAWRQFLRAQVAQHIPMHSAGGAPALSSTFELAVFTPRTSSFLLLLLFLRLPLFLLPRSPSCPSSSYSPCSFRKRGVALRSDTFGVLSMQRS